MKLQVVPDRKKCGIAAKGTQFKLLPDDTRETMPEEILEKYSPWESQKSKHTTFWSITADRALDRREWRDVEFR